MSQKTPWPARCAPSIACLRGAAAGRSSSTTDPAHVARRERNAPPRDEQHGQGRPHVRPIRARSERTAGTRATAWSDRAPKAFQVFPVPVGRRRIVCLAALSRLLKIPRSPVLIPLSSWRCHERQSSGFHSPLGAMPAAASRTSRPARSICSQTSSTSCEGQSKAQTTSE
jgi:hypothetical protein